MHILNCHADLHEAKTNLRKYLGQLVYLQNLAKVGLSPHARTHTHTQSINQCFAFI